MSTRTAVILLLFLNSNWKMTIQGISSGKTRDLFASRTQSDWRSVWHGERHRRCYNDLVGHMEWACNNDIYKESKRLGASDGLAKEEEIQPAPSDCMLTLFTVLAEDDQSQEPSNSGNLIASNVIPSELENLFLTPEEAMSILHSGVSYLNRKRKKRGIMDECCTDNGCTWEEYAEYCPTNRRIRLK